MAFLVRAGWGIYRISADEYSSTLKFPDEQQYWNMASSLRDGDGLRDEMGFRATRMPVYPAFLALFAGPPFSERTGIPAATASQWVIGAVAALLTACTATALFDSRAGILAGLAVAFDPFLVFFSSLLLSETLFITAFCALWWVAAPLVGQKTCSFRRWIALGLLGALCVYVREAGAAVFIALLLFLVCCRRCTASAMTGAATALLIVWALLVPWAVRNAFVTGEWVRLTTRAGISLYDGVGPLATGASDLGEIKQKPEVTGLSETEWNRYFLQEAFNAIRNDPPRTLRLAIVKWRRMWNPFPNVEEYRSPLFRVISATWMVPIYVLAVMGLILPARRHASYGVRVAAFLLLPAGCLTLLHALFVGSVRYRLPAMPMLEILAAAAAIAIIDRVSAKART